MTFVRVALPVPVRQSFLYAVPDEWADAARPGAMVEVPFRGRRARGVVVERVAHADREGVVPVHRVLGEPVLGPHLLELAAWVADYYLAPIGEVLAAALPGGARGLAASTSPMGAR